MKDKFAFVNEEWKSSVISYLRFMGSAVFRNGDWVFGDEKINVDPGELVCMVFDDLNVGGLLDEREVFSPETLQVLEQLDAQIDRVDYDQSLEEILASREWAQVQALALKAAAQIESDPLSS